MRKRNKNRLKTKQQRRLKKQISRFNKELKKEARKNPDLLDVQKPLNWKKEARKIETNEDFKSTISSLQRATNKGAFEVQKSNRSARATKWQIEEYEIKKERANRQREQRRKEIEEQDVKSRGESQGYKRKEMGSVKENELKPIKKSFENLSNKEWQKSVRRIEKELNQKRQHKLDRLRKKNYIKGMHTVGMDERLISLVASVPLEKFLATVETDEQATFDFIYDPLELQIRQDAIREVWLNVLHG